MTTMKTNALNWFEIHVADFDRAKRFYETILDERLESFDTPEAKMGVFQCDTENGVGGAIVAKKGSAPGGSGGTLVYLNADGKLDAVLGRVGTAGGKVTQGRTPIPPHGFIGFIQDTEGNRVGLHSTI
ncbi:VOC family protein [Opitutus terrae]|uniref:Glyoxalase/bleomycin resistance protein/dioxygenase n=1 Tax=Opitutus terrae (strain DSM 11246 / JCM 15787 / PB90-1) TaxID=452637 RepID=B1ZPV0_OPITP|nr:VOC family protein [Opitutus terrae]ACB75553.1 Glyoxalase/bleomycin resistance protein/dioxygenase [Opitutus terrae PB90-1]